MNSYDGLAVIILAAGKGTRMKSNLAKVLHKVDGKSMVLHVIESVKNIAAENIHVVVGHQADDVKVMIDTYHTVNYSVQKELLGTADAVKTVLPQLKKHIKHVLVLCGDVPLIQHETLVNLIDNHLLNQSKITVLATRVDDPTGYGRILSDTNGRLLSIREEADASEEEKKIELVNAGIYCFESKLLKTGIDLIQPDNNQAEYYLTDLIEIGQKRKEQIAVFTMNDPDQVMGVNTLKELDRAKELIGNY